MLIEELEEALSEVLNTEFVIEVSKTGEVVIFTGLEMDDDGELFEMEAEEEGDSLFDDDTEQFEEENDNED